MNLLNAILYDPTTAVSKATSSLLAMTAIDTTNLRLAVTVPSHGKVRFRMLCTLTGATTVPTILLGVLNGATVVGRITPRDFPGTANATTQTICVEADFIATGLTPGAANFDAAYAVQVIVASTNIKYGGPNNASGADAWGAFLFEAWDPQPLTLGLAGGVNVTQILGSASAGAAGYMGLDWGHINAPTTVVDLSGTTIKNLDGNTVQTGDAFASIGAAGAGLTALGDTRIAHLNADISTRLATSGYTAPLTTAQTAAAVWQDTVAGDFTVAASVGKSVMNGVALGTGLTINGYTGNTPQTGDAFARIGIAGVGLTNLGDTRIGNLDAAISSRLPTSSYSAPDNTSIAAIKAKTDNLPVSPADETLVIAATNAIMSRLGAPAGASVSADVAAVKSDTGAIKTKTDSLTFTAAGKIDANVLKINGVTVNGAGSVLSPWGP